MTSEPLKQDRLIRYIDLLRVGVCALVQGMTNTRDQALKGDVPGEAVKAVAGAMSTHRTLAKELLHEGHDGRRELLFALLYDLIREPATGRALLGRTER